MMSTKDETQLRNEYALLNRVSPMPKMDNFCELSKLYPSATNQQNFCLNRYKDVLPSENSRVKLQEAIEDSDYINANYIEVYKQKYISCQAPLQHTTAHFWTMVWEQKSPIIVMLTRTVEGERKKADVYWPNNEGACEEYGSISVTLSSVCKLRNITVRIFSICHTESSEDAREIVQMHYTEWPDFGVPTTTHTIRELIRLVDLFKERSLSRSLNGPIIAHCSAGIGRCGTFYAILICLEKFADGMTIADIDLVDTITEMRKYRCGMVQTEPQFIFIYQVLQDISREKQIKKLSAKRLCSSCGLSSSVEDLALPLRGEDSMKKRTHSAISVHQ